MAVLLTPTAIYFGMTDTGLTLKDDGKERAEKAEKAG